MSTNRSRRIDRDTAEHLLGGAVGGPSAGQDASLTGPDGPGHVARVLAAAAAPATAAELAGEEAALAAFREASLTPDPVVTPVRRRSMATAALARAFSTKAAAAVLGATALCGVAVAAGTGNLPSPLSGGPSEPEHTVGVPSGSTGTSSGASAAGTGSASSTPSGSARPSVGASGGPQAAVPSGTAAPGTPTADGHGARPVLPPAMVPLCQGFADRTGKGERPHQLAADPLFAQLIAAAGGADHVTDYCDGNLGQPGGDHQGATGQPSTPGRTDPGTGNGNGSGTDGRNGADPGKANANGGQNASGGGTNGQDSGGSGAKPGKGGVTVPTPPAAPTPPDIRPSRTVPSADDQSARR
ncbi:hypothetical protein [Kitasatospora sp. NPDC058190]|uniref:hypothetical protein n=1 Tax=Kitasatospora sp. NPDC058190 TaxID=3346371 RepID=UPI0036DECCD1